MSGFGLRPARSTDAGRVGAILSGFIDDTDWMPRIHTRAEDLQFAGIMIDQGWVSVAQDPSGVIGFLALRDGDVHALYVAAERRGRGVGSGLLQQAKGTRKKLSLWTFEANLGARRFYERHGFVEMERTEGNGNDEKLPDIRFEWNRKEE